MASETVVIVADETIHTLAKSQDALTSYAFRVTEKSNSLNSLQKLQDAASHCQLNTNAHNCRHASLQTFTPCTLTSISSCRTYKQTLTRLLSR